MQKHKQLFSSNVTACFSIIVLYMAAFLFIECHDKGEVIYLFPERMKFIDQKTEKLFVGKQLIFSKSSFSETAEPNFTEGIYFGKNGLIYNGDKKQIGKWSRDRKAYLNQYEKDFFFYWVDSKSVKLVTRYMIEGSDAIHFISITFVPKETKARNMSHDQSLEPDNEFN